MNTRKILTSPIINKAALARAMWPNLKDAKVRLAHKMKHINKQRITPFDKERIITIMEDLCACDNIPEVRCNQCGWEGDKQELSESATGHDACPICQHEGQLEDLNPQ